MEESTFAAPWGKTVAFATRICVGTLLFMILIGVVAIPIPPFSRFILIVVPLLILAGCAAYAVRGYVLSGSTLSIKRLFWSSRLDLSRLESVTYDPGAMDNSVRRFGNGGIFSISGRLRNLKLGSYRAFATDEKRAVVLRLSTGVIVITPDLPEKFVAQVLANRMKPRDPERTGSWIKG